MSSSSTPRPPFVIAFNLSSISKQEQLPTGEIKMQCTRPLLSNPGFWSRSLKELGRQFDTAVHLRGLSRPKQPLQLIAFPDPESLATCKTMSDGDMGGFSTVSFTHHAQVAAAPAHAMFKGNISLDLPPNRRDIQRSGYAAWRTRDRARTLFGQAYYNIDIYRYLALRVKSDGRKYFVNIQTDSVVPTDLHQHRLHARTPGEWETVVISLKEFVRTNYGMPVEPVTEILKDKITSVGIGLTDRTPGPFELCIADVYATNSADGGEEPGEDEGHGIFGGPKDASGNEQSMI